MEETYCVSIFFHAKKKAFEDLRKKGKNEQQKKFDLGKGLLKM